VLFQNKINLRYCASGWFYYRNNLLCPVYNAELPVQIILLFIHSYNWQYHVLRVTVTHSLSVLSLPSAWQFCHPGSLHLLGDPVTAVTHGTVKEAHCMLHKDMRNLTAAVLLVCYTHLCLFNRLFRICGNVASVSNKKLCHLSVSILLSPIQRSVPKVIHSIHISTTVNKQLCSFHVP